MSSEVQRYRPQLATTPWFKNLPIELQDYLVARSDLLRLKKGQQLYRRGEQSFGLYAILEGALSIGTVGADGKEALLAVLGPTAWIGEVSMFDRLPRPHDALALGKTLVLHVPGPALEALLGGHPAYSRHFRGNRHRGSGSPARRQPRIARSLHSESGPIFFSISAWL